jgi:hypothetical protein
MSPRRRRSWSAYLFTAISILVAISLALPFCGQPPAL